MLYAISLGNYIFYRKPFYDDFDTNFTFETKKPSDRREWNKEYDFIKRDIAEIIEVKGSKLEQIKDEVNNVSALNTLSNALGVVDDVVSPLQSELKN